MWRLIISTCCYPVLLLLFKFLHNEEVRTIVAGIWIGVCLMSLVEGIIALIIRSVK